MMSQAHFRALRSASNADMPSSEMFGGVDQNAGKRSLTTLFPSRARSPGQSSWKQQSNDHRASRAGSYSGRPAGSIIAEMRFDGAMWSKLPGDHHRLPRSLETSIPQSTAALWRQSRSKRRQGRPVRRVRPWYLFQRNATFTIAPRPGSNLVGGHVELGRYFPHWRWWLPRLNELLGRWRPTICHWFCHALLRFKTSNCDFSSLR